MKKILKIAIIAVSAIAILTGGIFGYFYVSEQVYLSRLNLQDDYYIESAMTNGGILLYDVNEEIFRFDEETSMQYHYTLETNENGTAYVLNSYSDFYQNTNNADFDNTDFDVKYDKGKIILYSRVKAPGMDLSSLILVLVKIDKNLNLPPIVSY